MRDRCTHPFDDAQVAVGAIGTPHRAQDAVRTRLQWHVQRRTHVGRLGHRLDDIVAELGGVWRGEAHPLQSVYASAGPQQLGECVPVTGLLRIGKRNTIGVDVLTQQRDLQNPLVDQGLDLGKHVAGPTIHFLATQRGNDAEGARVVTTYRDRNPCGVGRLAAGRERRRELLQRLGDLDLRGAVVTSTVEQSGQRANVVGAEHDVDPRRLAQYRLPVLLRQTSAHGDLHFRIGLFARREMAEVAVQLVVSVLPHRAGIEHDDVSVTVVLGTAIACRFEQSGEPLGVVHVHLAAIGPDLISAVGAIGTRIRHYPFRLLRHRGSHGDHPTEPVCPR